MSSRGSRKRCHPNHHPSQPNKKRLATADASSSPPPPPPPVPSTAPSPVLVEGLPPGCTVLELKSRLEMYGAISRIRVDGPAGLVTFRSGDSALAAAAAAAAADPLGGISLRSHRGSSEGNRIYYNCRGADPPHSLARIFHWLQLGGPLPCLARVVRYVFL